MKIKNKIWNIILNIFKYLLIIIFYIYLYKISVPYFNQLSKLIPFIEGNNVDSIFIIITILLMIPNWLIESIKWQEAISPIEKISLSTSIKGILKGIPPSTFTPNRIGETIGRPSVLTKGNKIEGGIATAYCGISQMPVMLFLGFIASLWFYFKQINFFNAEFLTSIIFIIICFCSTIITLLIFFKPEWLIPFIKTKNLSNKYLSKLLFFNKYTFQNRKKIILLSILRFLVYCIQNYLLLLAFKINIEIIDGLCCIFLIYITMSFIPRPALAELGVRCSISVIILQPYTENITLPATSSALLWIINIFIPCLIGTTIYIIPKIKKISKKFFFDKK
ncbi:MAG: flippase-like domain-containing protein [Bacteroidales bacterium]|nr:flippase-like domain-containing protein [Bacteroidales bacterium]